MVRSKLPSRHPSLSNLIANLAILLRGRSKTLGVIKPLKKWKKKKFE